MPRPRPPPTPASSTDILAQDRQIQSDMESVFTLPPPAMHATPVKGGPKAHAQATLPTSTHSPVLAPDDRAVGTPLQRKRTSSGSTKTRVSSETSSPVDQPSRNVLPPPPSRARKIIQMKPKEAASASREHQPTTAKSAASSTPKQTPPSSTSSTPKRKQPSATSAAGRKIARKTAHSIIERRRRSKMNEEFGVLKDMIPACAGVEMHKLAILQAGIEYLRYLEGCIEKLKAQNDTPHNEEATADDDEEEDEEAADDDSMDVDQTATASVVSNENDDSRAERSIQPPAHPLSQQQSLPPFRHASIVTTSTNSTYNSPDLRPINSSSTSAYSQHATSVNRLPPFSMGSQYSLPSTVSPGSTPLTNTKSAPTGVSPAFGAFQFSPDLSRTSTWSSMPPHLANQQGDNSKAISEGRPSPNILPLPQSMLPFSTPTPYSAPGSVSGGEHHAEVTATAALMMLTKDRRASISLSKSPKIHGSSSGKGMSVRDLLSS